MKFTVKGPFGENIYNLGRKIGYFFLREDREKKEFELARPARGYPRFHIFLSVEKNDINFKLHLDQKKPVYKGLPAHAGEYNTEIVLKEADRIKQVLEKNIKN